MTRKDYELIAREIWLVRLMTDSDEVTLDRLASFLVTVFEADNPRFRKDKFLEACGF